MKNTIIFDMDGTLLNTLEDIAGGVNHTMRQYGLPQRRLEEVRCAVGNGARRLIAAFVPGGEENPCLEQILQDYEAYYETHCQIRTRAYDGILEMLRQLKARQVKMAIVSNKGDGAVKELTRLYFSEYIAASQGVRDGIRKKPAPDSVLEALNILGSRPEETLYVGDSEVDYHTAVNAGVDCVLVSWGFREREKLRQLQPDYLIDVPEELLSLCK